MDDAEMHKTASDLIAKLEAFGQRSQALYGAAPLNEEDDASQWSPTTGAPSQYSPPSAGGLRSVERHVWSGEDHQVRLEAFRTPKLPRAIKWHIRLASGRASAAKVHHNKILAEPFIKQRGIIATAFVRRPGGAKRLVRAVAACQAVARPAQAFVSLHGEDVPERGHTSIRGQVGV